MSSLLSFFIFGVLAALVPLLLFRLLAPRRSAARQPALEFAITFDSVELILADLRLNPVADFKLPWSAVHRIVAYKRDLFVYDRVYLFVARAGGDGTELNEEMVGWTAFCEALPQVLPGCKSFESWFETVAFPAFATNRTELYVRP